MTFNKSAVPTGKKQASLARAKSAPKGAAAGNKAPGLKGVKQGAVKRLGKKGRGKSAAAFSTVESRQRALERVRRTVWSRLDDISDGVMNLAVAGNYLAAKALFDIAGVYTLPDASEAGADDIPAAVAAVEPAPVLAEPQRRAQSFLETLGIQDAVEVES